MDALVILLAGIAIVALLLFVAHDVERCIRRSMEVDDGE